MLTPVGTGFSMRLLRSHHQPHRAPTTATLEPSQAALGLDISSFADTARLNAAVTMQLHGLRVALDVATH